MEEIALSADIAKPTLYGYFRTKDELLLQLMLPIFIEIGEQLERVVSRVAAGTYHDRDDFIADFIEALLVPYRDDPDGFRLTQLLHQSRLVESLNSAALDALDRQGRTDFRLARAALEGAICQGLVRDVAVGPLADVLWGVVVGVIQVEEIKRRTGGRSQFSAAIHLAKRALSAALVP